MKRKGGVENRLGLNMPNPKALKALPREQNNSGPLNPKSRLFLAKAKKPKMGSRNKVR